MTLVAVGVDGARGGWIAAGLFADGRTALRFFPTLEWIADWHGHGDAPMAIDVPIGLMPLGGSRPCDFACRRQLPGRGSSVFPPPARFLVDLSRPGT
jgi:predicted RNase H-like nuclease